jgi:hypothetical protein
LLTEQKTTSYFLGILDEAVHRTLNDPYVTFAREWCKDTIKNLGMKLTSRALTGKPYEELPEEFRNDIAIWDNAFESIPPYGWKDHNEMVDGIGRQIEVVGEKIRDWGEDTK